MSRAARSVAYADTNLFVALFAGDAHPSHERAVQLVRRTTDGTLSLILTPITLGEIVYVTSALLAWDRATVAERLGRLLDADGMIVHEAAVLHRTLELYRDIRRLDFADAYIAAAALELGPTVIASFDADFDRVAGTKRIKQ